MFKDILQKFGWDHNCELVYSPNSFVVYEIKHHNHSETCKHYLYNY